MKSISLSPSKKIYFASDQHFGSPSPKESKPRENRFILWLEKIKKEAQVLFLMGDLFDFWHEWNYVVPKGYIRVLGKIAELKDAGVEIIFFVGNHDLWMRNYFQEELGISVYFEKQIFSIADKKFLLAHGDGLGPRDTGYKRMKKLFTHPLAQWAFRWLHPDLAMKMALYFSRKNKLISGEEDKRFLGADKEHLILYSRYKNNKENFDYFVFGHRHLPMILSVGENAKYINLGDWVSHFTYGVFDGNSFSLQVFEENGNSAIF
ncbi:MAG: UDP-2,3-diacylglucosamine diphosphatase [Bergeyella sp.]|nr:UDP-2,3-diacylglucosamine diphosphatase [Bergeyella sp.]